MYEYKATIRRVVDGDTVDVTLDLGFNILYNSRIRLLGIDAPESRTRDLEEKKYGLLAKEQVKFFLPVGSIQTLITVKDKAGKFGRVLGRFKIEEPWEGYSMLPISDRVKRKLRKRILKIGRKQEMFVIGT